MPSKPLTKAAFVRSLPSSTPAAEVVEKAKAAGLKLRLKYVYNVRASAKVAVGKKSVPRASSSRAASPTKNPSKKKTSANAEDLLKALGAELGLSRAIAILESERARVRAVLGA